MAPDPAGDGAEAGPLTSATPALPGRSPKPRISYSIEYATTTRLTQWNQRAPLREHDDGYEQIGSRGPMEPPGTTRNQRDETASKLSRRDGMNLPEGKALVW
jgi:hypothetical protein